MATALEIVVILRELRSQTAGQRSDVLRKIAARCSRLGCYISLKRWGRDDGISESLYDNHYYGQWTPYTFKVWEIINALSWYMLSDDDILVQESAAVSSALQIRVSRFLYPTFCRRQRREPA
jgi:hypothetical protein